MVQILLWSGEDRPPVVVVESLPFSNGNPSVNDTLQVVRGGSVVGTVTLGRVQAARRRAFVEIASGELPEAGDILRHNGNSEATIESVSHSPYRRGDITSFTDDGGAISNINYSTKLGRELTTQDREAGEWSDFVCITVPGPTAQQAREALANRLASILGLPGTPRRLPEVLGRSVRVEYTQLTQAQRDAIRDDSKATTTAGELLAVLALKRGITIDVIQERVTFNGRFPDEWTTYL